MILNVFTPFQAVYCDVFKNKAVLPYKSENSHP